jgi:hypothetical protein
MALKKMLFKVGFPALILIVVIVVAGSIIFKKSIPVSHEEPMNQHTSFQSSKAAFPFTFEYPSQGWRISESQGRREPYDAVYLSGPADPLNEFLATIAITVKASEPAAGSPELLAAFLKRSSNLEKFKVVSQKTFKVGGEEVSSAVFEYERRLPVDALDGHWALIEEQVVFLVRAGKCYRFNFLAKAEEYIKQLPTFEHLLKTFKFKD